MPEMTPEEKKLAEEKEGREDKARRDEEAKKKEEAEEEQARVDAARRDEKLDKLLSGIKVLSDRMDSIEKGRRDASSEEEEEQAQQLHELAEEEEKEAVEEAEEEAASAEDAAKSRDDKARRDARAKLDAARKKFDDACDRMKNDGRKRYDKVRGRMDAASKKFDGRRDRRRADEGEEKEMPWPDVERKDDEGDEEFSERVDEIAAKHDSSYRKQDDESIAAHCDRVARGARKDRARRADRARMDSIDKVLDSVASLATRVDRLSQLQEGRTPEDENAFAAAQSRADSVYQAHGDSAPRPLAGQNLVGYRIMLLRGMQKHSPVWKDTDVSSIARSDAAAFSNIENIVYADALKASESPVMGDTARLREISRRLPSGHTETKFAGRPLAWMSTFMSPGRTTTRIRPPTRT